MRCYSNNMNTKHMERHRIWRISWLRAAVLGANDGIISTVGLIIGVAAAAASQNNIIIAGVAGLIAGAISMAAGEYISVSSQVDMEQAELAREKYELKTMPEAETEELAGIYVKRGVEYSLAKRVAIQLMEKDALGAHARDELGITETLRARPFQAAISSALSFSVGALLPLLTAIIFPVKHLIVIEFLFAIFFLALLGGITAHLSGAKLITGIMRVTLWGALAMFLSAGIGWLLGVTV